MAGAECFSREQLDRREAARERRATPFAKLYASVPALLAMQESTDFPRDGAVVREYRSRRSAREAGRRYRCGDMVSGMVARPNPQHDRDAAGLDDLAPARVGSADSGGAMRGVRRDRARSGDDGSSGEGFRA